MDKFTPPPQCGQVVDKTILTASDVWTKLSQEVQSLISKQTFATWFEPIQAVGLDEKSLTL